MANLLPLRLQPQPQPPSAAPLSVSNSNHVLSSLRPSYSYYCNYYKRPAPPAFKSFTVSFALTQPDSPNPLPHPFPDAPALLKDLAASFVLPPDFFAQLPRDLRLDLNDAAFDLSNGPVQDECGKELGEILLDISRAWELADTLTSTALMSRLPLLVGPLTDNAKAGEKWMEILLTVSFFTYGLIASFEANLFPFFFFHNAVLAFGKRLMSAGRRFQSMGQYGQGELQRISKVMITTGKVLTSNAVSAATSGESKQEGRMLKFGELQVELTPEKAYIGAAIGAVFGILSWELSQGIKSIPESSMQYANDNALLLAKSLRGALLALSYSSALLSAFASVGLALLGGQLKSKDK